MNIIPKLQQGGSFDAFFSIYNPIQTEPPRQTTRSSESRKEHKDNNDEKGQLSEKDFFTMIKEIDALPNELQQISSSLLRTLRIDEVLGTTNSISNLATRYVKNLLAIKNAKFNKDLFKETYDRAKENNSLHDYAIDGKEAIVLDTENNTLVRVDPKQWKQIEQGQNDRYKIVTNSNVLWLRYRLPQFANDNEALSIVENGIGMDKISELVKANFRELGSDTLSSEQIFSKEAAQGEKIISQMLAAGPEGYYKLTQEMTGTDKSKIEAALDYIYTMLPENAKTRLKMASSDGTEKAARSIILNMINGTLDTSNKSTIQYLGSEEKLVGKKEGSESDKDTQNIAEKLIAGYGQSEMFAISMGDEYFTQVHANVLPLVGQNDNPLGVRQPISEVTKSSLGNILNLQSASIGGQVISPSDLNHVITQDGKIRTIDFPCIVDQNGRTIPNLSPEVRDKRRVADYELRRMGINPYDKKQAEQRYQVINQVYQRHQLPAPYKSSGQLNDNWARFAIMAVATDGKVLRGNTSVAQKVEDKHESENIVSAIKEADKNYSFSNGLFGLFGDDMYKGTLWVPLYESYNLASATKSTSASEAMRKDMWDQAISNRVNLTTEQIY